ncbi:hypothetical protein [Demequina oxidasica]|uniref:hypothetical protein n=1 Tax=Demequina oxidasica TaxID=676199 RepID=UPI000782BB62|nr:hypothetical protein [Demequina oxidasica]
MIFSIAGSQTESTFDLGSFFLTFSVAALFAVLAVGLIGGFWFFGTRRTRNRHDALVKNVAAKGYSYLPEYPARTALLDSAPFGLGETRWARDVVWGNVDGRPFETFAYSYELGRNEKGGGEYAVPLPFQITWIPLPAPLPLIRLSAQHWLVESRSVLGDKDLDVESHEFNERWTVSCADDRLGHAILSPRVIEQLLAPVWSGRIVVIEQQMLMTYSTGHTDLSELEELVSALYGVADSIPAYLGDS